MVWKVKTLPLLVSSGDVMQTAERLTGRLLAEVQFCTIDEVFERGLHQYLDDLQLKLNAIGAAIFNAYFFQQIKTMDEEIFVQQEEQQQQGGIQNEEFKMKNVGTIGQRVLNF